METQIELEAPPIPDEHVEEKQIFGIDEEREAELQKQQKVVQRLSNKIESMLESTSKAIENSEEKEGSDINVKVSDIKRELKDRLDYVDDSDIDKFVDDLELKGKDTIDSDVLYNKTEEFIKKQDLDDLIYDEIEVNTNKQQNKNETSKT